MSIDNSFNKPVVNFDSLPNNNSVNDRNAQDENIQNVAATKLPTSSESCLNNRDTEHLKTNNYYIVNSAIYNNTKNPKAVDGEVEEIVKKSIELADEGRKVVVVIGINAPKSTKSFPSPVDDEQMGEDAKRIKQLAEGMTKSKGNVEVRVVPYRWDRFDDRLREDKEFKANERVNYVDIRNRLFDSSETQEAIRQAIEAAQKDNNSSVKLLALDGDSEIQKTQVQRLEKKWDEKLDQGKPLL